MRYRAVFIAGVAVGFIAGARAGRETYDKIMSYGRQVSGHPKVQQAASAMQAKTTELTRTAAAKAPDYAKSAMSGAASTVSAQVPKVTAAARHAAADKIPARLRGGRGPAGGPDDVAPDGNLVYPAENGSTASENGSTASSTR